MWTVLLVVTLALVIVVVYGSEQLMRRQPPDQRVDPSSLGIPYQPVRFNSTDGVNLGGYWFAPARTRNQGAIILCHGQRGSLDPDLQYVPALHAAGYGVLSFDFRAHGRSGGSVVSMGYYERRDLLGAVDFLVSRGYTQVGVLGLSMGGSVAISTAAACPQIGAVVSDCGFARVSSAVAGSMRGTMMVDSWPAGFAPLGQMLAQGLASLIVAMADWRLRCHLTTADPIYWIGQISPRAVFLIQAEHDPFVPLADVEMLYRRAGEPKQIWLVPGAGHRQIDQFYPSQYRARIIGFFERYLAVPVTPRQEALDITASLEPGISRERPKMESARLGERAEAPTEGELRMRKNGHRQHE